MTDQNELLVEVGCCLEASGPTAVDGHRSPVVHRVSLVLTFVVIEYWHLKYYILVLNIYEIPFCHAKPTWAI